MPPEMSLQRQKGLFALYLNTWALKWLKYLFAMTCMIVQQLTHDSLQINCTFFFKSKCTLLGFFSFFFNTLMGHGDGQLRLLYANVCLVLLQQSNKMTNTVQNILLNNFKGTAC